MAITKVTRTLLSTGIVDNSNATAITIDSSENVGIGLTNPSDYYATELVVDASDEGGISVVNGTTEAGYLAFADGTSGAARYSGYLSYDHNVDALTSRSAGYINFMTGGGTERMRIDSSGNVGIGTGSPAATLHTQSTVPDTNIRVGYDANKTTRIGTTSGGDAQIYAYETGVGYHNILLAVDSGSSAGNVGIGTSSPSQPLTVSKAGDLYIQVNNSSAGFNTYLGTYTNESRIVCDGAKPIAFFVNGSRVVDFANGGNVGIGTSSPSAGLHVETDVNPVLKLDRGSANNTNANLYYNGTLTGQLSAANAEFQISAAGSSTLTTFFTNGGERMRIDSSGRVMVNQTAASAASAGVKMQVNTDILSRGTFAGYFWENRSGITIGSLTGWGGWYSTGTSVHSLYSDGNNIVSINRSSGAYTALSDKNKKKDFEDSTVGLTEVMQLQPKKFRMIDDADDAPKKLGFVAQDVENIIPEAYFEDTNEDASGVESTFIGLTDRPIIAALTKAIQEQQTIIDDLKTRIETLESA
jgi:hypothetical protein